MKTYAAIALAATILVAGCKEEEDAATKGAMNETQAAVSCSQDDLMKVSQELATKLQQNPEKAQELVPKMQELAPKLQAATTSGEIDAELTNELCAAYKALLAQL